jgi:hypothetical protein
MLTRNEIADEAQAGGQGKVLPSFNTEDCQSKVRAYEYEAHGVGKHFTIPSAGIGAYDVERDDILKFLYETLTVVGCQIFFQQYRHGMALLKSVSAKL